MRLSVVIATKDRARYLERALVSLTGQRRPPSFEVIVVDNGSSDATKEVVERAGRRNALDVKYVFEPEPNRGKARNRGIAIAQGYLVLFCDDDVVAPPGFLAAHEAAHVRAGLVVNGPIVNVPSYDDRPGPSVGNYSRAFLCTCNVSVERSALQAVGGFDEDFNLYGWEDTELGGRLRARGSKWAFSWDAYIWHIKPPSENTLEVEAHKAFEKAKMARRFIAKSPTVRARMATGAHPLNVLRGRYLLPESWLRILAGVAVSENVPQALRSLARAQLLDGIYTRELVRLDDA